MNALKSIFVVLNCFVVHKEGLGVLLLYYGNKKCMFLCRVILKDILMCVYVICLLVRTFVSLGFMVTQLLINDFSLGFMVTQLLINDPFCGFH